MFRASITSASEHPRIQKSSGGQCRGFSTTCLAGKQEADDPLLKRQIVETCRARVALAKATVAKSLLDNNDNCFSAL